MSGPLRTVGQLAREAGISVRTLHHYDELGLLPPSARSPAGYRLYGVPAVRRLHQILALRALGLPLGEIRRLVHDSTLSHAEVIDLHLHRLHEERAMLDGLIARLEAVRERMTAGDAPEAEDLLQIMEVMAVMDKIDEYYTPEQRSLIEERGKLLGAERIREVEAEWPKLIAEMRAAMNRGDDPSGPEVQSLARRWQELIEEFTGGDPGIGASLQRMYESEPSVRRMSGIDDELSAYVGTALRSLQ